MCIHGAKISCAIIIINNCVFTTGSGWERAQSEDSCGLSVRGGGTGNRRGRER